MHGVFTLLVVYCIQMLKCRMTRPRISAQQCLVTKINMTILHLIRKPTFKEQLFECIGNFRRLISTWLETKPHNIPNWLPLLIHWGWTRGGGGRYSLSTIGRWCSKFISRNSQKTIWDGIVLWLNLDAAKTLNLFSVFSIIGWKVAQMCGTINKCWSHVHAFREKRRHIAYRIPFVFFSQNIRTTYTERAPLWVLPCS